MSDTHAHSIAFVRTEELEQQPPPSSTSGPVKWLRENLFATPANALLTIVALYFVYLILTATLPWILNGIWNTDSLTACREVLDGATGACFSVLTERWNQLLFGFKYPPELYWRPTLALVLLGVAAAPVLFFDLPRKLLAFTAVYPFIAFWLIWGGSIWTPIFALLSVAAGVYVYQRLVKKSFAGGFFGGVVAAVIVVSVLLGPVTSVLNKSIAGMRMTTEEHVTAEALRTTLDQVTVGLDKFDGFQGWLVFFGLISDETFKKEMSEIEAAVDTAELDLKSFYAEKGMVGMTAVPSRDLGGFMLNMMLGVTCVSLSIPLGIALALGRQSHMPLIKWICVIFIEFIRGVPLITLLFVASVMLSYFFPPESTVDLFLRVVIMITMFSAAYIAEVIRGGLAALPKGQYEGADSLGLDYAQATRLIILPQALKISIPGIVNVAVGLFKDTTLVSVISMFDLVGMIRGPILASTEWNGVYWELLGFAALLFFVVCYGISQYSQWLERRLATDHR